ncbi:MAG TPA: hypothetical protein ENI80_10190 [Acidiferrobacteraceae bacterium]|nr:hypothetical protein [Acidiferrobacteraceae bacterium]
MEIILLAESHVFTDDSDREISIPEIEALPGYPNQYARFVYCLGYGERNLTKNKLHPKRDGTPPFWKIFFSCNNLINSSQGFSPILRKTPFEQRLNNKINLLKALKEKGIWLVDTSIVGLYKNGKKVPGMFQAMEKSWHLYTCDVVKSASPNHIICVGKGVAGVVKNDLQKHFPNNYSVVSQPTAFLSSEEHMENFKHFSKICYK